VSQSRRFRDLIAAPEILILPGAWDALSALLIEQAGFPGVYVTGGGIARSSGVPDIGLITMHEQVARVKMICDAVSVPVLADADTGHGNALHLMRTVREMEAAGAAGIHIEDQVTPSQESYQAGADVVFIEAPRSVEEIKRIADTLEARLLINMVTKGGETPYVATDELERLGYDIVIFASEAQRAAIFAMRRLLEELRVKRTAEFFEDMVHFQDRKRIVNTASYPQLQECYLCLD
jgi:2-methylisocitrate lyase-like PEP mutase family enzyme